MADEHNRPCLSIFQEVSLSGDHRSFHLPHPQAERWKCLRPRLHDKSNRGKNVWLERSGSEPAVARSAQCFGCWICPHAKWSKLVIVAEIEQKINWSSSVSFLEHGDEWPPKDRAAPHGLTGLTSLVCQQQVWHGAVDPCGKIVWQNASLLRTHGRHVEFPGKLSKEVCSAPAWECSA